MGTSCSHAMSVSASVSKERSKKDNRLAEKEAMHLAETTDVSLRQAKVLVEKHGRAKSEKEAKNFKAES